MTKISSRFLLILIPILSLSACTVPDWAQNLVETMKRVVGLSFQSQKDVVIPEPNQEFKQIKAYSELVTEMILVTFHQSEINDPGQLMGLVSSLSQGASLEGVYRGLVMSSAYRVLESNKKSASPESLKFFALEMAELQVSMNNPTSFDRAHAKLAPSIEYPEGIQEDVPLASPSPMGSKEEVANQMLDLFFGATPFTLKRVLAEETLKKIDELSDSKGGLPQWYADMAIRLGKSKVDFGLPLRNSSDYDFHFRFAGRMPLDRVKWETLNRYFRVINRLD